MATSYITALGDINLYPKNSLNNKSVSVTNIGYKIIRKSSFFIFFNTLKSLSYQ